MNVLLIYGVGYHDDDPTYFHPWMAAITDQLRQVNYQGPINFATPELRYDNAVFADEKKYPLTGLQYIEAITKLLAAGIMHGHPQPEAATRAFGLPNIGFEVRWRAGVVAQLMIYPKLREALRDLLVERIEASKPDIVFAHSMGSLIIYDLLMNDPDPRRRALLQNATLVTFGSQIGNTFANGRLFNGRLRMPQTQAWYHFFNRHDPVLTAPINLPGVPNFLQLETPSLAGHDPVGSTLQPGYLTHPNTFGFWGEVAHSGARKLVGAKTVALLAKAHTQEAKMHQQLFRKPARRALLIGINRYPNAEDTLEGCVNDVFLMSAALQERGFAAANIRVVLDERATAAALRERLTWLLEDAEDGTERVLFYSGHGAQLPGYNAQEETDHVDECLVPHDFAWTPETAVTDDFFSQLYANLPLEARFFAIFDCCHCGGMTRASAGGRARGLQPPDDIRHRLLEWDQAEQMWRHRTLPPLNDDFGGTAETRRAFMGNNGATLRLGRAMRLRPNSKAEYDKFPPDQRGPYLPVLLESCGEGQLSYEYRHGVTSYGAFTYALVKNLRANPRATFTELLNRTNASLVTLGFDQQASVIGPSTILDHPIPGAPPAPISMSSTGATDSFDVKATPSKASAPKSSSDSPKPSTKHAPQKGGGKKTGK